MQPGRFRTSHYRYSNDFSGYSFWTPLFEGNLFTQRHTICSPNKPDTLGYPPHYAISHSENSVSLHNMGLNCTGSWQKDKQTDRQTNEERNIIANAGLAHSASSIKTFQKKITALKTWKNVAEINTCGSTNVE